MTRPPALWGLLCLSWVWAACADKAPSPMPAPPPVSSQPWELLPAPPPCERGQTPLMDGLLAQAGVERGRAAITPAGLAQAAPQQQKLLDDPFTLPWFRELRASPFEVRCAEQRLVAPLDAWIAHGGKRPVAGTLRHAASLLGQPVEPLYPHGPALPLTDFEPALRALCQTAGGCSQPTGALPDALKRELAPVLWALRDVLEARYKLDALAPRGAGWWRDHGGHGLLLAKDGQPYDLTSAKDRAYLLADRAPLYAAAARLAWAVEGLDRAKLQDLDPALSFTLSTPAGLLRVRGAGPDRYEDAEPSVLLHLDLGGDDVYLGEVASNRDGPNAASLWLDLGGRDLYSYPKVASPHDAPLLSPSDKGGRFSGDAQYGPISLSDQYRQAAARDGVAMLFDFGPDDDVYESLVASQGYAHFGVAVLYDEGGDDTYSSESASQGAALFGIALLMDLGAGRDVRRAFTQSQGFGFVSGAGILLDDGGDDTYTCDVGDPSLGGLPLYHSPQRPKQANSSFCQGVGFGRRGQGGPEDHLSGGLGLLRDLAGDDRYEASVFAQGAGYWQGTGLLADGAGRDQYDALWYGQGAAAHYAVGLLFDGGDEGDRFNARLQGLNGLMGAGHDYSLGALLNDGGDDEYHAPSLSLGSANCNSLGLFVDLGGDDRYEARSDAAGAMSASNEMCLRDRPDALCLALMLDVGGQDVYSWPASPFPTPSEAGSWGYARQGLPSQRAAGLDAPSGDAGLRSAQPPLRSPP